MLIVAMTTVGYGDIYPVTILGRLAVAMVSLVGILFIAIFCFLASQALILSRTEKRVLAYYESKGKVSLVGILFIAIFCFLASQALILSRTEKRVLAYYESKGNVARNVITPLNHLGEPKLKGRISFENPPEKFSSRKQNTNFI